MLRVSVVPVAGDAPAIPARVATRVGCGVAHSFERANTRAKWPPVRGFRRDPERLCRIFGRRRLAAGHHRRGTPGATPGSLPVGPLASC